MAAAKTSAVLRPGRPQHEKRRIGTAVLTEIRSGFRGLLGHASLYQAFQRLMGAERSNRILADRFLAPASGQRVLDIGCGPADILSYLPAVDYLGFDPNPNYIHTARQRYGTQGRFEVGGLERLATLGEAEFDLIQSLGVLHHMDDDLAQSLFQAAAPLLGMGGRLVTADAVLLPRQRWASRLLVTNDRGQNVRNPEGYLALAQTSFAEVDTHVWSDIYRVPYDVFVMTCREPII